MTTWWPYRSSAARASVAEAEAEAEVDEPSAEDGDGVEAVDDGAAGDAQAAPAPPPKLQAQAREEDSLTFVESWLRIPPDVAGKEIEEDIVHELVRRHAAWIAGA